MVCPNDRRTGKTRPAARPKWPHASGPTHSLPILAWNAAGRVADRARVRFCPRVDDPEVRPGRGRSASAGRGWWSALPSTTCCRQRRNSPSPGRRLRHGACGPHGKFNRPRRQRLGGWYGGDDDGEGSSRTQKDEPLSDEDDYTVFYRRMGL